VVALVLVGADFFKVPGTDPVRAGGWYFVVALEILVPAAVVILILSLGIVALLRRAVGARVWPGVLQAAPAVALVLGLLFLVVAWLFSGPETG